MAVLLLTASFLMGTRLTPNGIHCPSAAVQLVSTGNGFRAPLEKEEGFKQCRCKESQAKAEKSVLNSGAMMEFVLPQPLEELRTPRGTAAAILPEKALGSLEVIWSPPLLPPPDLV